MHVTDVSNICYGLVYEGIERDRTCILSIKEISLNLQIGGLIHTRKPICCDSHLLIFKFVVVTRLSL